MAKILYEDKNFIIKKSRDYVLINKNGRYNNHGHFDCEKKCHKLISMMNRKQVPHDDEYFQESILRISVDEKYKERVRRKQERNKNRTYYYNPQKGLRKK